MYMYLRIVFTLTSLRGGGRGAEEGWAEERIKKEERNGREKREGVIKGRDGGGEEEGGEN